MNYLRRMAKLVSPIVILGMLLLSVQAPMAQAALLTTDAVLDMQQAAQDRATVRAGLERADVAERLLDYGVKAQEVQARVDHLSDSEVHTLAENMEQLPAAGGDPLGVLLFVFLVLLITDLLGLTDVFPFVKKHRR